jgi:hypothetical protein
MRLKRGDRRRVARRQTPAAYADGERQHNQPDQDQDRDRRREGRNHH